MPNIVTVTFSPCIDKSTTVPQLIPEKKLHCSNPVREAGGGGINVARALTKLGEDVLAIYPIGGPTGINLNKLVTKEGVESLTIKTSYETRENLSVTELATNNQYRFGMPGIELLEDEWEKCLHAIAGIPIFQYLVISGSMPPGSPADIFKRLSNIARERNAKLVVDTSGNALQEAVQAGVYLIKPNLAELAILAGKTEIHIEQVDVIARELIDKNHFELVVISLGPTGAIMVTKDSVYRAIPPAVVRKSTVGAGDSMVAGILFGLVQQKSMGETLRYGVACGTAACLNPGTALCKKEDVERILKVTTVYNT
ncbi:1-phosphofructokinase family hexose kinase [Flavihumibacter profundi]|uniref:1-phosphofructokinase family hexose kinase n=1 Tax=Flavihumibacter profundi TaxID=2716883 RepID=UPI001CC40E5E|nr:1-phosphofructokinase family hexose kinase [Flavihumibacter profundi]MBZ5856319.1 1-phosphofructokinase family hexose kinase [Flavihumibacter profundi]